MFGRASVLAVYLASVYFDVWGMIKTPGNVDLLSVAFFLAFISADSPWATYSKNVNITKTEDKEE